MSRRAPRVWQRMLSGRRLDLMDPSPLDIELADIAHGLARVARWNGQTTGEHAFSVAQHSLVVEQLVAATSKDARWQLAALLHDAPEYVIGDMISPFKSVLGAGYKTIENRLQRAIHLRFGLPADLPPVTARLVKRADKLSAYFEATLLAGFTVQEAEALFCRPDGATVDPYLMRPLPAGEVEALYIERFSTLDTLAKGAAVPVSG